MSVQLMNDKPTPPIASFYRDLVLGYGLLGLQPVFVRVLSTEKLSPLETVWIRFTITAGCIGLWCLVAFRRLTTQQPAWLVARGLLGAVAVYLYFSSVASVGAARATLLNYTYPFWANLLAVLFGARPSPRFWLGLCVAFLGVIIVVLPMDADLSWRLARGDMQGLASAVLSGAAVLVVKQLRKTDDSLTIVASFTLGGLLMSSWDHPVSDTLHILIDPGYAWAAWGVGLSSFFGHLLFTRGYRGATVQQATLLSLMVPVIASALGVLVLGEPFQMRFALGASLVLFALSFVARGADPGLERTT